MDARIANNRICEFVSNKICENILDACTFLELSLCMRCVGLLYFSDHDTITIKIHGKMREMIRSEKRQLHISVKHDSGYY